MSNGLGGSMSHSQGLSNNPYPEHNPHYQSSSEAQGDASEQITFYSVMMLASRQTPKLEDHSWSTFHDCLFNIFAANLHIRRPTPHPQPEGTRHAVVTGTQG